MPSLTCQGESFTVETATREGEAIAVSTVGMISPGGNATKLSVKRMFRLETPDTLVVEGTMAQAGQSRAVATVYKNRRSTIPAACRLARRTGATPAKATIADVRLDRRRLGGRHELSRRGALDTAVRWLDARDLTGRCETTP